MPGKRRYPKLNIQSKNELAKHISRPNFSKDAALALINDVQKNHERYWRDSSTSEPAEGKFVRSAIGTPLGILLEKINQRVLAPHDKLLPPYIFGGIQGLNHIKAAAHLLGMRRKRTLLTLDIATFFDQIGRERVQHFLVAKCGCGIRAARLISELCCVPKGKKNSGAREKTIARGFATSSRLAVWSNLDTFVGLNRLIQKRLKGCDPRLAIYVDDIGITAARVPVVKMETFADEVERFLYTYDEHQRLPSKAGKRKIRSHVDGLFHLGLKLERRSLAVGPKTRRKIDQLRAQIKDQTLRLDERSYARRKYRSLMRYKAQVLKSGS